MDINVIKYLSQIMFRAWEEHLLGTPLHFLLQSMTDVLHSLDEEQFNNYAVHQHICSYEVESLLMQLHKHVH